jgi:hypothetical protein
VLSQPKLSVRLLSCIICFDSSGVLVFSPVAAISPYGIFSVWIVPGIKQLVHKFSQIETALKRSSCVVLASTATHEQIKSIMKSECLGVLRSNDPSTGDQEIRRSGEDEDDGDDLLSSSVSVLFLLRLIFADCGVLQVFFLGDSGTGGSSEPTCIESGGMRLFWGVVFLDDSDGELWAAEEMTTADVLPLDAWLLAALFPAVCFEPALLQ